MALDHGAIFKGDWRTLPRHCGGNVEVMDQTIGCPDCGQNLWYLPNADLLPLWAPAWASGEIRQHEFDGATAPPSRYALPGGTDAWSTYADILDMVHPFKFDDCHDPGDEDDDWWRGKTLAAQVAQRDKFGEDPWA